MNLFRSFAPTRVIALLLFTAAGVACSDSTGVVSDLPVASVAGTYVAVQLETTEAGETTDWLVDGASIRLELRVDGTTAGRMFIPAAGEEGGDLDADLAGEWSISGQEVHLDHDADTFLRDLPFRVLGRRLEGGGEFSGVRVQAVLVREGTTR